MISTSDICSVSSSLYLCERKNQSFSDEMKENIRQWRRFLPLYPYIFLEKDFYDSYGDIHHEQSITKLLKWFMEHLNRRAHGVSLVMKWSWDYRHKNPRIHAWGVTKDVTCTWSKCAHIEQGEWHVRRFKGWLSRVQRTGLFASSSARSGEAEACDQLKQSGRAIQAQKPYLLYDGGLQRIPHRRRNELLFPYDPFEGGLHGGPWGQGWVVADRRIWWHDRCQGKPRRVTSLLDYLWDVGVSLYFDAGRLLYWELYDKPHRKARVSTWELGLFQFESKS